MAGYPCFVENGTVKTSAAGFEAIKKELERQGCRVSTSGPNFAWGCKIIVCDDDELKELEERFSFERARKDSHD